MKHRCRQGSKAGASAPIPGTTAYSYHFLILNYFFIPFFSVLTEMSSVYLVTTVMTASSCAEGLQTRLAMSIR